MSSLNVVRFDVTNLMDIPAMLRKLADEIEKDPSMADHCIVVLETPEGKCNIRGFGKVADTAREIGILECAKMTLIL